MKKRIILGVVVFVVMALIVVFRYPLTFYFIVGIHKLDIGMPFVDEIFGIPSVESFNKYIDPWTMTFTIVYPGTAGDYRITEIRDYNTIMYPQNIARDLRVCDQIDPKTYNCPF